MTALGPVEWGRVRERLATDSQEAALVWWTDHRDDLEASSVEFLSSLLALGLGASAADVDAVRFDPSHRELSIALREETTDMLEGVLRRHVRVLRAMRAGGEALLHVLRAAATTAINEAIQ